MISPVSSGPTTSSTVKTRLTSRVLKSLAVQAGLHASIAIDAFVTDARRVGVAQITGDTNVETSRDAAAGFEQPDLPLPAVVEVR